MKAKGTYTVGKWEEAPYEQISTEMKMTKASVQYLMSGEIDGRASVEYLMLYKHVDAADSHKSSAVYIGLVRFTGSVHGKTGSFVMEDHGAFESGAAASTLQVIAGSGLGELKNIHGAGRYVADRDGARIELEYEL